jgi:hypothetical protein
VPKKTTACAEKGVWTPVPVSVPADTTLSLARIDPDEDAAVSARGRISFHLTGCSGDTPATNTKAVAAAITAQNDSSFLYHLGDMTYVAPKSRGNQVKLMNRQFLAPYSGYPKQIVAIAGNHDGKRSPEAKLSAIQNFLANFCAAPEQWPAPWPKNKTDERPAMIQPYPYWRLDTPLAFVIGLYANISNGGMLDDPATAPDFRQGEQYRWLVAQLEEVAKLNVASTPPRAVLLAVHYPPYAGASDFVIRGAQRFGETPAQTNAPFLGVALQEAFVESGQRADLIVSAHAHLFQRLTYSYADGTVLPCVIVGNGGHSLERMFACCDGRMAPSRSVPFPAVAPDGFSFPTGESARVDAYQDADTETFGETTRKGGAYGFVRVTIERRQLTCTFFRVSGKAGDRFALDLDRHQYLPAVS